MSREQNTTEDARSKARKVWWLVIILILLLLLLLLLFWRHAMHPAVIEMPVGKPAAVIAVPTPRMPDTSSSSGVAAGPDTVTTLQSAAPVKGARRARPVSPPETATVAAVDSSNIATPLPDTNAAADTISVKEDGCAKDTAELWVYPDPSGGLHYREVEVRFVMNRPATIHYQLKDESAWRKYDDKPIPITATTTLYFDALDSCGKVMERRSEYYEIERRAQSPCHPDMEQVKVGSMNFCVDRYEWPNRRGAAPKAYISQYQASDSCYSVGKRLCTADEWMIACAGPYTWKYPYGQSYERYGCVTHDSMPRPSGSKPECRGFFGAFDMSGNLLEWTSTRSVENQSFTYVMGGFWESGPKSGCRDKRYSYYPQNQHNPVGFRCCRDLEASTGSKP